MISEFGNIDSEWESERNDFIKIERIAYVSHPLNSSNFQGTDEIPKCRFNFLKRTRILWVNSTNVSEFLKLKYNPDQARFRFFQKSVYRRVLLSLVLIEIFQLLGYPSWKSNIGVWIMGEFFGIRCSEVNLVQQRYDDNIFIDKNLLGT